MSYSNITFASSFYSDRPKYYYWHICEFYRGTIGCPPGKGNMLIKYANYGRRVVGKPGSQHKLHLQNIIQNSRREFMIYYLIFYQKCVEPKGTFVVKSNLSFKPLPMRSHVHQHTHTLSHTHTHTHTHTHYTTN